MPANVRRVVCPVDGTVFATAVPNRRYCSALCRSKRDNKRKRMPSAAERARWAGKGTMPWGSTIARGYGVEHKHMRAQWAPIVARGGVRCTKCGYVIMPNAQWDLGHNDARTQWTGPEHPRCNRRDGAVRGNRQRGHRRRTPVARQGTAVLATVTSRAW